jgi:hypothetical protein
MNKLRYTLLLLAIIGSGALLYFSLTREKIPAKIVLDVPQSIKQSETFDVPLRISTTTPMNAAEFYFSFPAELVEVTEVSQTGSIYSLWIKDQPAFNNALGELSLAGGLPKPGFVGRNGLVATVKLKAKKRGDGVITLDQNKSRILANDGLGTKIEATFEPVTLTVK